jgi:phage tail-like protein
MTANRKDPFLGFNFAVEIEGVVTAGFSEVAGLQAEVTVHEYQEGGVNEYIHKRSGPVKYPSNLVLKRGIADATDLWSWYCDVLQGNVERKNLSVVLMNSAGEEKRRWNFQNAYPVKWVGPDMRATASEVAVETMELAHEGLAQR